MSRRGPMPDQTRSRIVTLFAVVALMAALPVCVGVPVFVWQTATVVSEFAPSDADRQLAAELNAAAADAGRDVEISAVEIANARRLGQLDEVEIAADHMFEGRWRPDEGAAAPAPRQDPTAYYPPEKVDQAAAAPWKEVGLALGGVCLFLAAALSGLAAVVVATQGRSEPST